MKTHKLAKLFPLIQGDEFDALVSSVKVNGLLEPITTLNGSILDGRNRDAACIKAGVKPQYIPFKGDDPLAFVLAKNLDRRHLNESQRADVAAKMVTTKLGDNQHSKEGGQISIPTAAAKMKVSERTVKSAIAVRSEGINKLVTAVEQGILPVSVAAKIAKEDDDEQRAILAADDPKTEINRRKRAATLQSIEGKAGAMPDRKYMVI